MTLSSLANRALAFKLLAAATTYGFMAGLARLMAAPDFGTVAFFMNAAVLLSVIGARGQQMAALRFAPPLLAEEKADQLGRFAARALRKALHGAVAVALLGLAGGLLARALGGFSGISGKALALGAMLIPLVGWADLQAHFARAGQHLGLAIIPREILWRMAAGGAILGLYLAGGQRLLGPLPVLTCLILSLALLSMAQGALLLHAGLAGRFPRLAERGRRHGTGRSAWKRAEGPFWLSSVSNIFLANADVMAVALILGAGPAGLYFAANRLAMLLAFFQTSCNIALGPLLAQYWQAGKLPESEMLIRRATLKMTWPTLAFGLVLAALAPQALALFGPGFSHAAPALRLLVLAGVLNAALGPADLALNMCGCQKEAMWASALSLLAGAVLLVVGALLAGASGVAAGVLAGTALRKGLFWGLALHHLGLRCDCLAPARCRATAGIAAP